MLGWVPTPQSQHYPQQRLFVVTLLSQATAPFKGAVVILVFVGSLEAAGEVDLTCRCIADTMSSSGHDITLVPQDVWRMPTIDEIVRSLARHGQNAGCVWGGQVGRADCEITPDKETLLWAPDQPPVYYWSADEYDEQRAYYASNNGHVGYQLKDWGNPRHGHRCVREP